MENLIFSKTLGKNQSGCDVIAQVCAEVIELGNVHPYRTFGAVLYVNDAKIKGPSRPDFSAKTRRYYLGNEGEGFVGFDEDEYRILSKNLHAAQVVHEDQTGLKAEHEKIMSEIEELENELAASIDAEYNTENGAAFGQSGLKAELKAAYAHLSAFEAQRPELIQRERNIPNADDCEA